MKIYNNIIQGSEEWLEVRRGKITGSILPKLISSKTFKPLIGETATSALCNVIASKGAVTFKEINIKQFADGHIGEGLAREKYRKLYGDIDEVGFLESDCGRYGMSPDGIVGEHGFIEIKTIDNPIYVKSIIEEGEPALFGTSNYYMQILMGFIVNPKFEWCDFIMYNLYMEQAFNFKVVRINRNEEHIEIVKKILESDILPKLDELENKFMQKFNLSTLDI